MNKVKKKKPSVKKASVYRDWSASRELYPAFFSRLKQLAQTASTPQVVLIEGKETIDKTVLASALCASFFCEEKSACGACSGCRKVMKDEEEDVFWLETSESSLKLGEAHLVREHLLSKPWASSSSRRCARVATIIDCDKLNDQAANCLLKTLEEPHELAFVIMTTSRLQALLPTLISRSVKWHVRAFFPPGHSPVVTALNEKEWALFAPLLSGQLDSNQISAHAEAITRDLGLSPAEIANKAEIYLNKIYRGSVEDGVKIGTDSHKMRRRRASLAKLHELTKRCRISLNAQLSTEELGGI